MSKKDKLLDFHACGRQGFEDPRRDKCKKHLLIDIIAISVCGVICGCDVWDEVEDYGKVKYDWFKELLVFTKWHPFS